MTPETRRYEAEAKLKFQEQERIRDTNTYQKESPRLSRRAYVLIQLTIILLIILGIVVAYHFIH